MTEQTVKLIEVILALVQALIWPLVVLFILIYFGNVFVKRKGTHLMIEKERSL